MQSNLASSSAQEASISTRESTHYSNSQDISTLLRWAERSSSQLREALAGFHVAARPIFTYQGLSGISYVTALASEWHRTVDSKYGMIYVRKPREETHGIPIERNLEGLVACMPVLVFVDDFISSGRTLFSCMRASKVLLDTQIGIPWCGSVHVEITNEDVAMFDTSERISQPVPGVTILEPNGDTWRDGAPSKRRLEPV